ncbi:hypothetical protein BKA70DRAFT_576347 [Coprinopsis sp. MPI-PUGE-AT-0042]|nr:hypothetical protein BKA70DRAFT_576347 [Coprinopsis sp. MPI-PUGE-AT-0042]
MSYPVDSQDPASGPPTGPTAEITAATNGTSAKPKSPTSPTGENRGEQPLESHEVIELQTFSDRQAWIEEKIKFLENLPPIEVFAGLDALRGQTEECPGLPSREKLRQWMAEHDAIEKETEVFDTGELKKLRQLTKAATQRNLSPADTDLIEITLTTIYALDKLLHLLRDRTENLELLTIRLDWEENRTASWKDRTKILEELEAFIKTRARWSPEVYDTPVAIPRPDDSHSLSRRGSVASLASIGSESASNNGPSLSRGARFKLAELLARDAAQFGAKITGLCHGKVATAGWMLDKLIDHSRKPVPDELLDEQERLEEKTVQQLDQVGKFTMDLVMQWRKADEIYMETMKDHNAAQELYEEIHTAKLQHPTLRQSSAFTTRLDTILKRLALRSNPSSRSGTFPRPEHPLFPDQSSANESLSKVLTTEIASAQQLAEETEKLAKEYREVWEAVKRVETIAGSATELSSSFSSILKRLREGVPGENDEGHPPELTYVDCLNPSSHSIFLALLPGILDEVVELTNKANEVIKDSHSAFDILDHASIDPHFKSTATTTIRSLVNLRDEARQISNLVSERATHLRETRQVANTMDSTWKELERMSDTLSEQMERACWKPEPSGNGAPPTPESPAAELEASTSFSNLHPDLDLPGMENKLTQTIDAPLASLVPHMASHLREHLEGRAKNVRNLYEGLLSMRNICKVIQEQAEEMTSIRDEHNAFLLRIEDVKQRFSGLTGNISNDQVSSEGSKSEEASIQGDLGKVQTEVTAFIDGLSKRVHFVSGSCAQALKRSAFAKRKSDRTPETPLHLPVDVGHLDSSVRSESNACAMRLNGALESVSKAAAHLTLVQLAKELDKSLASTIDAVYQSQEHTKSLKASFDALTESTRSETYLGDLDELISQADEASRTRRLSVSRCFSPLRDLLRKMDPVSQNLDDSIRQQIYAARLRSVDDVETRYHLWAEGISNLKELMVAERAKEVQRLEELRLEEERKRKEEEARKLAEEEERRRLEEEERLREEERKKEEERQAELQRIEEERLKKEAEEAERLRVEEERKADEENERLRLLEESEKARAVAEQVRLKVEEAEKERLRQEKLAMEARLQQAEATLAEERAAAVVREREARIREEEQTLKIDAERRQMQQTIKEVQERLVRAEAEARKAVGEEKKRLETEIKAMKVDHRKALEVYERTTPRKITKTSSAGESRSQQFPAMLDDDVFGGSATPSSSRMTTVKENNKLHASIAECRKKLRSFNINEVARPSKKSASLPTRKRAESLIIKFKALEEDVSKLPASCENMTINAELRSLRSEMEDSAELLDYIQRLVPVADSIENCDTLLSDLLEHIDSYPSLPQSTSLLYTSDEEATPEQQLTGRLQFTKQSLDAMEVVCNETMNDARVRNEKERLHQTWLELEEMAADRTGGRKSRPPSIASSRPDSARSAIVFSSAREGRGAKKRASYANLSVASGGLLAPPRPSTTRRSVSGESRASSRLSTISSSSRSVSGPMGSAAAPTFASRQRTTSLSTAEEATPRQKSRTSSQARPHAGSLSTRGTDSPSLSGVSTHSANPRSTNASISSWSRAPRESLSALVGRNLTPPRKGTPPPTRKKYVANPKHKLDVAVGDVVNNLPVGIKIEGVKETWKDQSGKYWIGDQEPKLCFCRILRSQTVMVRIGGGWQELSKFIQNHFADSFKLHTDSPPSVLGKNQEEKWISSATLLDSSMQSATPPPEPPKTPEPKGPFIPSFSLLTPTGHSPRSIPSSSPSLKTGSPLTALQYMRKAGPDPNLRPGTPTKAPLRARNTPTANIGRPGVWRP